MMYHIKKRALTLVEGATHVALLDKCRKNAFTLAEVLITLGIIGVVAALTLSNLVMNFREKQTISQFNRNVSMFSQAFTQMANDNGGKLTNLFGPWGDFRHLDVDFYKQYFKLTKMCIPYGSYSECMPYTVYSLDRETVTNEVCGTYNQVGLLADGTIFCIAMPNGRDEGWEDRFYLAVDMNGFKGPNATGYDIFQFYIKNNGTVTYSSIGSCDRSLKGNGRAGWRCSEWIMKKGNMDYLRRNTPNSSDEWNN